MSLSTLFVAAASFFAVVNGNITVDGTFAGKHTANNLYNACLISLHRANGAGGITTTNNEMVIGSNVFAHLELQGPFTPTPTGQVGTLVGDKTIDIIHINCPGSGAGAAIKATPPNVAHCSWQKCASGGGRAKKNSKGHVFHMEPCVKFEGPTHACVNLAVAPTPSPASANCLKNWVDAHKSCPLPNFEEKDHPEKIGCPSGTCTASDCCQQRVHCGMARCEKVWTFKSHKDNIDCLKSGCNAATCCDLISYLDAKKMFPKTSYKTALAAAKKDSHYNDYPWPAEKALAKSTSWVSPVSHRRRLEDGESQ